MARMRGRKVRESSGGYDRLFGDAQLGALMSMVQSTCISNGSELERIIAGMVPAIADLDAFLRGNGMEEGVLLARKSKVKESQMLQFPHGEPDFMLFKRRGASKSCHLIELKDGHVFDTKKAAGEVAAMREFSARNSPNIPFVVKCHFCAFNQESRSAIAKGFKKAIPHDDILTGREMCDLMEIDYDSIVEERKADAEDNLDYFLSQLLHIDKARERILGKLAKGIRFELEE